jgi:hypothetical protein
LIEFNAYCYSCKGNVPGKLINIEKQIQGDYLYKGICDICFNETKRVIRREDGSFN